VKLLPLHYIHIRDVNKNIVKVVTGPRIFTCEEFEEVVHGPAKMISIPPDHYVVVENPVVRDESGNVVENAKGEDKLRYGDEEVRFHHPDPFPLYYGEVCSKVSPLPLVKESESLKLRAKRDFKLEKGDPQAKAKEDKNQEYKPRKAGEMWLFDGPGLYYPKVGVEIVGTIQAKVLGDNEALLMRALEDCLDWQGDERKAGEEWVVNTVGAYTPQVHEEVIQVIHAHVINNETAIHVRAKHTFTDERGKTRKAGAEWLISRSDMEVFFPGIHEEVLGTVKLIVMYDDDYCIIGDPWDEKKKKNCN